MANMNTSDTTNAPRFTVGKEVRVWKLTGVRELKGGPSTSERPGGEYADITPAESLMVIKTFGSKKALVKREDGSECFIHLNHIDRSQGYNTSKKRVAQPGSIRSQLEAKKKALQAAQASYEELLEAAEGMSQDLPQVAQG